MKALLKKEFGFTATPLTYLFLIAAFMTLLPGYPILCGSFFVCLGIFYTFQMAREGNDVLFSSLMPIRKKDVVRARYVFVISIQMIAFLINVVLTIVRMTILADSKVYLENALMNANLFYLGLVLLIFAAFNLIFVAGFWKDAYRIGVPFITSAVVIFLIIAAGEALHYIPGLGFLNTPYEKIGIQSIILAACAIIYVLANIIGCRRSERSFETVQL